MIAQFLPSGRGRKIKVNLKKDLLLGHWGSLVTHTGRSLDSGWNTLRKVRQWRNKIMRDYLCP